MSQSLKELLKPPFIIDCHHKLTNGNNKPLIDLIHWTDEGNQWNEMELDVWISTALNEKYERDFAEPMRWIYQPTNISPRHDLHCPNCKTIETKITNFCPNCGQILDPPYPYPSALNLPQVKEAIDKALDKLESDSEKEKRQRMENEEAMCEGYRQVREFGI